jgi:acyl-CoA thioester hydrolase
VNDGVSEDVSVGLIDRAAPSAGWFEGREHFLPVRVYYEDTDFTGVVYHANYVRYFERGRSDFLRLAGIGHAELLDRPDPAAFVITRLLIDFKRPGRIDDGLLVRTTYDVLKGAKLEVAQTLLRGDDILATADVHAACIHLDGRPRRPPPELGERLGKYLL